MDAKELLVKIREDRPEQKIHEVISFIEHEPGVYEALCDLDMHSNFFGDVEHVKLPLIYPRLKLGNVLNLPHYD